MSASDNIRQNDMERCVFVNKDYEYLSDEHADYIRALIGKTADRDKNHEVFGAGSHKYHLNETVSPEWVREFEKRYQVELPEEYVFFLTKVGNGGAGPYYGIVPLSFDNKYENLSKPSIYDAGYLQFRRECVAFSEKYDETLLEEKDNALYEKYDDICERWEDGVLNINTQGCTYDTLLVVNGYRKGEIVYIDWNLELGYPPVLTQMTFLEWYQGFFEEILAGYDMRGYGYRMSGNTDELMEKYVGADPETKCKIISTFFKFNSIDQGALSFISQFDGVDDADRLRLIFKFDVKKGLAFFERFFYGNSEQVEVAVNACTGIPDEYRGPYYAKMLDCIYGDFGDGLKRKAFIFIRNIPRLSAGDLLAFAANKENSAEIRKTCIYVIGAASDRKEYVDAFVDMLNTADSEQVLLEMLVTLRNVKSEKIAQAYRALLPKYRNSANHMIVKNMESYLGTIILK